MILVAGDALARCHAVNYGVSCVCAALLAVAMMASEHKSRKSTKSKGCIKTCAVGAVVALLALALLLLAGVRVWAGQPARFEQENSWATAAGVQVSSTPIACSHTI